jgi:hypothetical protein
MTPSNVCPTILTDITQMLMLSEAYLILSGHPSTHPSKTKGFAQARSAP